MKCKFCGAEVKLGERCQYCGSVAEAFYYKPEEPPEVVGRNQTDRKEIKNFEEAERKSKVSAHDIHNYAAGSRNKVYGWEITAVKEYPRTVTLEELGMKRAPQSWQYMR